MMRAVFYSLLAFAPSTVLAEDAVVDTTAAAPVGSPMMNMLPLLLIFAVFYFLLIKPQQKRMKDLQATVSGLKKGDKIVTAGGIIGKVTKLNDDKTITVEIANGVEVAVVKSTISGLVDAPVAVVAEKKKPNGKANKNDNAVVDRESVANDN